MQRGEFITDAAGEPVRMMADLIARSRSTISRELRRNADPRGGSLGSARWFTGRHVVTCHRGRGRRGQRGAELGQGTVTGLPWAARPAKELIWN